MALTRKELTRTAEAQERSGEALRLQAQTADHAQRLEAINHLLKYIDASEQMYSQRAGSKEEGEKHQVWMQRKPMLVQEFDNVYSSIMDSHSARHTAELPFCRILVLVCPRVMVSKMGSGLDLSP